jgi:intracellular sulfur oxidation DsrE/DsrF family protein
LLLGALFGGCVRSDRTVVTGGIEAIGLARTDDIRAVYQINTDKKKGSVGAGLHYLEKLLDTYNSLGVQDEATDIHAVLHGDAAYWLLRDEPYVKAAGGGSTNPNKAMVAELIGRGVGIEICAQTMRGRGWRPSDILDGVHIVVGAYPRVIDLQLRGYAYIRF